MLEMILGKPKAKIGGPILGYNWSAGTSTSSPDVTTYSGGVTTPLSESSALAGYSNTLRALSTTIQLSKPTALNSLALQDFTCEGWFWCSTIPNNYQTLFQIKWPGIGDVFMQFGDSGFGNRLQTGLRAAYATNETFSTPYTRANFLNAWHHIALVRKDSRIRLYIDGVLQAMAAGTSTTYNVYDMTGNYSLTGTPSLCQISGTYATPSDIYTPEFLFTLGAKYTANFTPPKGPIVSLT